MSSSTPPITSILRCHDGVWQLVPCPSPGRTAEVLPPRSALEMATQIAALQIVNDVLQLEIRRATERAEFQLAEAEHRLKNTFTTIHALSRHSAQPGDTGEAFRAIFEARLLALGRSHELLGAGYADGVSLAEVIGRCLQPYEGTPGRATVCGPAVLLAARDVPPLGLAFHELTTNAAKYGALSIPEGRVEVTWQLEAEGTKEPRSLAIVWRERDGPRVKAPERRGFGSHLLERGLAQGSGGTTKIDFAPEGVACRIWLPLTSAQILT